MSSDTNQGNFISKIADQLGEPTNLAAEWISFQKCPYCQGSGHKLFYVHSDTHNFKCHHCQEAGSKWKLAKTMTIELVGLDTNQRAVFEIKHLAAEFFQDKLLNDPLAGNVRKYLAGRGIHGDLLKGYTTGDDKLTRRLPIGFHPGDKGTLKHFKQFEFTGAQLNQAGILLNTFNAKFTGALIFINYLRPDRIARFKARKVNSDDDSIWLNGGGAEKGVFGLDWHTWSGREAVAVEGEFDALSILVYYLAEHGTTTNVVSLGGGAGGPSIDVLAEKNGVKKIRLIPDNDAGGINFAIKMLERCRKRNMVCTFHSIPREYNDPADWIQDGDVDMKAVQETVQRPGEWIAKGMLEWDEEYIKFDQDSADGIEAAQQYVIEQAGKLSPQDQRDFAKSLPEDIRQNIQEYAVRQQRGNDYFEGKTFVQTRLSRDLMEADTWLSPGGNLHKYSDGAFRPVSETILRRLCRERLGEKASKARVMEVATHISDMTYVEPDETNRVTDMLNVTNGMLDWNTQKLIQHDPKFASTIQLPVEYKPGDFESVTDILLQWVDEGDIEALQEFLGYCLIPDTRFEKALMLVGSGANGKSCLLSWVGAMIGEDNTASIPLQDLDGHKFKRAEIFGKLINIFADLPAAGLKGSSYFKMIVSGDRIDAERKGRDPFFFKPFTKLIYSANEIPRSPDNTPAYFRRWIIIEFPNIFEYGDNADDQFLSKLTTTDMLSALLNFSLAGLARLLQNRVFTIGANAQARLEDYQKANDPVTAFLSDRCKVVIGQNIERAQLFGEFMSFCQEQGYKPTTKQAFYNRVRAERIAEKTINGKNYFTDLAVLTDRVENFPPQGGEKVENFKSKNTLF